MIDALAPFVPSEHGATQSGLLIKSARYMSFLKKPLEYPGPRFDKTSESSHFSSRIEGGLAEDPAVVEALLGTYEWLRMEHLPYAQYFDPGTLLALHDRFFSAIPAGFYDDVTPGALREVDVMMGRTVAPAHDRVPGLLARLLEIYDTTRYPISWQPIVVASAHHRLLHLHPFRDGNGRVIRLWTDALLTTSFEGYFERKLVPMSRLLYQNLERYRELLAYADQPRRGDQDGRGPLTEAGLIAWCEFFIDLLQNWFDQG